jgi:hypothetical protein
MMFEGGLVLTQGVIGVGLGTQALRHAFRLAQAMRDHQGSFGDG